MTAQQGSAVDATLRLATFRRHQHATLRVLTYHRIAEPVSEGPLDPALISATPGDFYRQMTHLVRWYEPVSLDVLSGAFLRGEPLPRRAVHVTFDDAYEDFRDVAWPVLRSLGIPVTLFVATAYPGDNTRSFWWDRLHRARVKGSSDAWERGIRQVARQHGVTPRGPQGGFAEIREILRHLPHDEVEALVDRFCLATGSEGTDAHPSSVLGWDELRTLGDEGVTFGAHTQHHVPLAYARPDHARREIRDSLDDIEHRLGTRPTSLAYPYGLWNPQVARIAAEEGCTLGFTCLDGANRTHEADPLRMRRSNVTRRTSPALFAVRMLPWFARVERWIHRGRNGVATA